mmetsp:Transcript_2590/g.4716  ORF Transcript_2590/g.4716 Transcript_2590/m.4716 type:complete len:355 (+) Transcript_2590:137-1201(+)
MSDTKKLKTNCKRWMVIDTDAGVDDAFALALAMRSADQHNYEVKLFTTVFGNCNLDQVIKNVSKCRSAANCATIEMSRGCEFPIVKEAQLDAAYFHGLDGMGNNTLPDEDPRIKEDAPLSAQRIIEIVREAKQRDRPLTLVMLGPLTNLAEAIKIDAEFVKDIAQLVIMGGCGNARGNVQRTTEFNVVSDPEAASIVFHNLTQNNQMCTIVSWELTMHATIPWTLFDAMNNETMAAKCRLNDFLHRISSFSYAVSKRGALADCGDDAARPGAVICDAVAVAVALCIGSETERSIVTRSKAVNVEVELEGRLTRGQTVVDWGCFDGVERQPNCHWVQDIDHDVFAAMFKEMYAGA